MINQLGTFRENNKILQKTGKISSLADSYLTQDYLTVATRVTPISSRSMTTKINMREIDNNV